MNGWRCSFGLASSSVYPMSTGRQKMQVVELNLGHIWRNNMYDKISYTKQPGGLREERRLAWVGRSLYCKQPAQIEGGAGDDGGLFVKKIFPASHNPCPPLLMFRREGDD